MPKWLIYILVAAGVFLLVEIGLVLAGKKDLAKKLVLPFILIAGALAAPKLFGKSTSALKADRDRIEGDRKKIDQERDEQRRKLDQATQQHEQEVAELEGKISESDAKADSLKDQIAKMKAEGPGTWFDNLPEERKKEIMKKADSPGLEDQFLNQ